MRSLFGLFLAAGLTCAFAQSRPTQQTISLAEAHNFGSGLESGFLTNRSEFFEKSFDVTRLLEIAIADQPGREELKDAFRSGFMKGGLRGLSKVIAESFTSYKLLRVVATNQRPQLVFRCLDDQGALNYHILELERKRGVRIRVVDMFTMISGEKLSELARRVYLASAAEADRSFLSRLALGEGDWVKHGKDVQKLGQLAREGDSEAALKLYENLPKSLRSEKFVLLARLQAAQNAGEEVYLSAIEAFEKQFPNDPSLALLSVDGFVIKKQPRKAIAAIQTLDRFIGGDPYLLLLQAGQYLEVKDKAKARELGEKAVTQEPSLSNSYDFLLGLALEDKDYVEMVRLLNLTEKNLEVDMLKAIHDSEEYTPFLESAAGKKWKENHKEK